MRVSTVVRPGLKSGYKNPDIRTVGLAAPIRHALQALKVLAARPERTAEAAGLARSLRLPAAALAKSFQRLARKGLLEARRGPGGGYRLAVDPARVSLLAVADALELEDSRRGRCLLEERECGEARACALHHAAREADQRLRGALESLTLADLAAPRRRRTA
jgi:Rrf2 family protein